MRDQVRVCPVERRGRSGSSPPVSHCHANRALQSQRPFLVFHAPPYTTSVCRRYALSSLRDFSMSPAGPDRTCSWVTRSAIECSLNVHPRRETAELLPQRPFRQPASSTPRRCRSHLGGDRLKPPHCITVLGAMFSPLGDSALTLTLKSHATGASNLPLAHLSTVCLGGGPTEG